MVVGVANRGETFHHNNPSPLTDNLYLSAARAISSHVLRDLEITCVINATLELPTMAYQLTDCLQIAVEDRIGSKLYVYFDLVADKINSVHLAEGKLMIYCRAGMSRSASLCIAYFMKHRGMSLDEAYEYVRARRPIIHPNVGFLRQLREYERKLRGRSPIGRSIYRGKNYHKRYSMVELPALKFASEDAPATQECGTGIVEWDGGVWGGSGVKVIKPIAKPRRPSVRYSELFDHYAESCPPQVVDTWAMLDDGSGVGSRSRHLHGHAARTRVDTAAVISGGEREALAVALVRGATPMMEATISTAEPYGWGGITHPVAPPRRKPFRKISEPAKIAVSFLNQALCLSLDLNPLNPRGNGPIQMCSFSYSTVAAEQLPQVSEALALECLGDIPDTKAVRTTTTTSTARMRVGRGARGGGGGAREKRDANRGVISRPDSLQSAILLLSRPHLCVADKVAWQTWESEGVFKRQRLCSPEPLSTTPKKRPKLENFRDKFPGLKTCPQLVADERHCLAAAACAPPPVVLEQLGEVGAVRPVRWGVRYPSTALTGPLAAVAVTEEFAPCEFGSVNMKMRLKIAWLLAVPLQTAVEEDAAAQVTAPFVEESEMAMTVTSAEALLMPSKEFPYYSVCKASARKSEFVRAREEPVIQSSWFFALAPRKSTKTVCMVPKVEVVAEKDKAKQRRSAVRTISWAADRYDVGLTEEKAKALPSLDRGSSARRIFTGEKLRSAQSVLDENLFSLHKTRPLRRFAACLYDPWSISAMAVHPMNSGVVVETFGAAVFELHNLYCEPTRIGDSGKESIVEGELGVAELSVPDVRGGVSEVVEIPDAFGDMTVLKKMIMEQNDPVKISIWLEVFKRGVIVSRPIFPFTSFAELLTVAVEEDANVAEDCFQWEGAGDQFGGASKCKGGGMTLSQHYLTTEVVSEELPDDCFCDCIDVAVASVDIAASAIFICVVAVNVIGELLESFQQGAHFQSWNARRVLHPFTAMIASKMDQDPMGSCVKKQQDIPREFLKRKPFQKITLLHVSPPQQTFTTLIQDHLPLPEYEFVQDIEDQADLCHHFESASQSVTSVTGPVDTLWFFELEKPVEMEASGAVAAARPVTPFQLYLPDSFLIDKVGQEGMDVFKPEEEQEGAEGADPESQRPLELVPTELRGRQRQQQRADQQHLIEGSVKLRNNRAEKRISFVDSGDSRNSRDLTRDSRDLTRDSRDLTRDSRNSRDLGPYGLVSYQKPTSRTRSVSRSAAGGRRNLTSEVMASTSMASEDARTMAHLKASMKRAEEVLDRRATRRSTSATRAPGPSGPSGPAAAMAMTVEERLEERRSRLSKARDSRFLGRESQSGNQEVGNGSQQGTRYVTETDLQGDPSG